MPLPALATADDVTGRAPDLTVDADQVGMLLGDASAIVRTYAKQRWVNEAGDALEDVPDGVAGVVANMVIRALRNPDGATQQTAGPFGVQYGRDASDRLFLTGSEKLLLRDGGQQAFSVSTFGDVGFLGTVEDEDWT